MAAADVVSSASGIDSAEAHRAAGVAFCALLDFRTAAAQFERAATVSRQARDWSDVAAARLETSLRQNAPQELVGALVAADRALALEPRSAEATFNRAATIDAMGLRRHAANAWRRCLAVEKDEVWRARIRARLDADDRPSDDDAWPLELERLLNTAPSAAGPLTRDLATRYRQHARLWAESVLPADWAAQTLAGDEVAARRTLLVAGELAAAVQSISGDMLAAESIGAIRRALPRTAAARELAEAYVEYRNGRVQNSEHDAARAREKLLLAAAGFARANSPMRTLALYYASTALANESRNEEAAAQCDALKRGLISSRLRAPGLAAAIEWQIAHSQGVMGRWDVALAAATESATLYRGLGETENTGASENMLAEIYDFLGQPAKAWAHRRVAFERLSAAGDPYRLQVALGASSRVAIRERDWPPAVALLDLELEVLGFVGSADLVADAMMRRARVRAASGDEAAARADLASARAAVARIPDQTLRATLGAAIDATAGVVDRSTDPAASVAVLTRAIGVAQSLHRSIVLPELFLERGRSRLVTGDLDGALDDWESGIAYYEKQLGTVTDYELSGTAPDVAAALFTEAVRAAAARGDAGRAFDIADRAHGRAILGMLSRSGQPVFAARAGFSPPPGTVVVQYFVLPDRVVVFTLARELEMTTLPLRAADLERLIGRWRQAMTDGAATEEVGRLSSEVRRALLNPIRRATEGRRTIVFIASRFLESVPWAALYDSQSGRYLIEDTAVTTAPSVAFLARAATTPPTPSPGKVVVVGNPRVSETYVDLPPLPGAYREARRVAAFYQSSVLLTGAAATIERFLAEAAGSSAIHFAGHAVSSERSEEQSFLALASNPSTGASGLLYARDIARLSLRDTRLVVLAACGTARGSMVHLDGSPSIARAFLAAGAPNVIGTLWNVDDRNMAALFADIHRAVADGTRAADAVRAAQVRAIRSGDESAAHPKTWASVTLVGSGIR